MESLIAFLQPCGFSIQELEEIKAAFQLRKMQKGDFFAKEGETTPELAWTSSGVYQYFYLHPDGREITTYMIGAANFLVSLTGFLKNEPSRESIRALADGLIWTIQRADFQQFVAKSEAFRSFYIQVLEHQILCVDDSRQKLLTLSAEERYARLLAEEPHLLQMIPLQYLASILGVTPRHLSRIRSHIR